MEETKNNPKGLEKIKLYLIQLNFNSILFCSKYIGSFHCIPMAVCSIDSFHFHNHTHSHTHTPIHAIFSYYRFLNLFFFLFPISLKRKLIVSSSSLLVSYTHFFRTRKFKWNLLVCQIINVIIHWRVAFQIFLKENMNKSNK